jgi:hypothetical protein
MGKKELTLEERVARLESQLLSQSQSDQPNWCESELFLVSALVLSIPALFCAFKGTGLPNHPYQVILGLLTVLLAYHRNWILWPKKVQYTILSLFNCALVIFFFKLLIGSGTRSPFYWLKYPYILKEPGGGKWYEMIPNWSLSWEPSRLALWQIDLTIVQMFLLTITIAGALFRFQPFSSLSAILLILVSLPAYTEFNWSWVMPAIILTSITLYLQSPNVQKEQ